MSIPYPYYFRKNVLNTLLLILCGTTSFAQRPAISSFSPRRAPVGTTVTITGDHFSATPSQNVVYFGPVKAVVQTATTTTLTVKVPPGAAYCPISVTNTSTRLTAYSSKPFLVTFPGGDNFLSQNSFENDVVARIQYSPRAVAVGDLDGDGKPDAVVIGDNGGSGSYLSILRNTSSPRHLSFGPSIDSNYAGFDGWTLTLADLNGDGLLDLVTSSSQNLSVFKNISTPGNIRFSLALSTSSTTAFANSLEAADMDNDGRTDLVFVWNRTPTVMRNLSSLDTIRFANAETILPPPTYPGDNLPLKLADFDEDGKADIALAYTYVDSIIVVHNNSTPGNLSFDQVFKYNAGGGSRPVDLFVADIDGDDRVDIAYTNNENNYNVVLRNITTPGNLYFDSWAGFPGTTFAYHSFTLIDGDINGDGKPDIAFTGYICCFTGEIVMLLNNSIPCNAVLNSLIVTGAGTPMGFFDMDGDGKADYVGAQSNSQALDVRRNNISQQFRTCAGDSTTIPSLIGGTNYQWQQNTGSGFTNIPDGVQFYGTNSPFLQLKNIPGSLDNTTYRCIADSDTSNVFTLFVNTLLAPSITIADCPGQLCSGNPTTIFYASAQNGGSSPAYQWQDSTGVQGWKNIGQGITDSLHYQATADGSKIRCLLRSSSPCALPDSAVSNTVVIHFSPGVPASNIITGTTAVNLGESTTLTASPTNGGYWPQYQWQDSTGVAGWTNIPNATNVSVIYSPGKTGDKIRCVLRSASVCAFPKIVNSNALILTINAITAINSVPAGNYRIRFFPNPSFTVLNIDSLQLSDKWQTLEILALSGQKRMVISLAGITNKTVDVSSLPAGIYLAILRKKNNQVAYYKFIKQVQ